MNLKASLTRKYGPLSLGVWLIVVAAVILVYRYFRPGSASSSTDASSQDAGGLASGNLGPYGIGGGGAGSGIDPLLPPTNQAIVDPGLTGPGTPIVYDPLTGTTNEPGSNEQTPAAPTPTPTPSPLTIAGGLDPAIATAVGAAPLRPRAAPTPSRTTRGVGIGTPEELAKAAAAAAAALAKQKPPKKRPKTTRGVKAAPQLVSEHGKGGGYTPSHPVAHPTSTAHAASASPTRTTQTATTTVERPRSSPDAVVNAGARLVAAAAAPTPAPMVGTTTSAKTYAAMGRKGEIDV